MKKNTYHTKFDVPEKLSNSNLRRIYTFYVLECPVPDVSFRGNTFEEYGFKGNVAFSTLRSAMIASASPSLKANYRPSKEEELEENFKNIENVSPPDEYCVFLKNDEKSVMNSLYKAIRNAFAHGSFNVKSYKGVRVYFLLNFKKRKKAQIVLQEQTLLSWMDTIQSGYEKLQKRN